MTIKNKTNFLNNTLGDFEFKKGIYSFLNPYSAGIAIDHEDVFCQLDGIYIDGILLLKILNKLGFDLKERISFDYTSIAGRVFESAVKHSLSVAIIGSTESDIKSFRTKAVNSHKGLNITFSRSGYFDSEKHRTSTLKDIADVDPDIVICGMGTPKQEEFLTDLKSLGWDGYGYTCGGFIHQTANSSDNASYYPNIINKLNLRALYRIWDEPRLIKRYLYQYPISIIKLIKFIKNQQ